MTCAHVLGLIDSSPFGDYPRAHLDAAWRHARQCATCGPALAAATALTADLTALLQPAPPDLTAGVLARIALLEDANDAKAAAAMAETSSVRDRSGLLITLAGVAAGIAIVSRGSGGMATSVLAIPNTTTGGLILTTSLLLYLVGLFAPVSNRNRREP